MRKLKEEIREVQKLVVVSNTHASITLSLFIVFLDAYHRACYHFIIMTVVAKFKADHCRDEIFLAAYVWNHISTNGQDKAT